MKKGDMIATRDAYGEALAKLGGVNREVVVLDADLSGTTRTKVFKKAFPERFFDCGIAETNMTGIAAGLAACGKIPFISTFAIFGTGRNYDAVRNSVCYPALNVKLALTHAGLMVGEDGATHQSLEDISLMAGLPNMTVLVPADAAEAEQMIFAAASIKGPVYIRLGRAKQPVIFDSDHEFKLGRADVLRKGSDVTLAACGVMTAAALEAADVLAKKGFEATVVNFGTIKPIDKETVLSCAAVTGAFVACEEHSIHGGLGSIIAGVLAENKPVPMEFVAVNDRFGQSGKPNELLKEYGLTPEDIVAKAEKVISRK